MIRVLIPRSFKKEREYITNLLLIEFLGIEEVEIDTHDKPDYIIRLDNGNMLVIRDGFFSKIPGDNYLSKQYLPKNIKIIKNPFIVEKNIFVLYGTDEFFQSDSKIICGIDIFASAFFMIVRWEEYVNKTRDKHDRFPAIASVAYKNNFLDRPIVNEYLEMLWNMLKYLGLQSKRKKREFQFILTHDIDHIEYWKNYRVLAKHLLVDVLKHKSFKKAIESFNDYYLTKKGSKKDPYDTFKELMDLSEQANIKSRFYFMANGNSKFDDSYLYEYNLLKIIQNIKERGHIIGFHPSYNTYNSIDQWSEEKKTLERRIGVTLTEGRQHYLRFSNPETFRILEENQMNVDSTLGYADYAGFRCGVCYDFPVFDFLKKKQLHVKERPLIVMDTTIIRYQKLNLYEMYDFIERLIDRVKKYNGDFVFLWHNSNFNIGEWKNYSNVYNKVLKSLFD